MIDEFRRNLPHFYEENAVYDITFRLVNTIPRHIFQDYIIIKEQLKKQGKDKDLYRVYNDNIGEYLDDTANSKSWLANTEVQAEVLSAIYFHHKKSFYVIAFCIMPNHVHLIVNTLGFSYSPLGKTLGSIKQFSARKANLILQRKGQFWHHESYDHMVRSRNELAERVKYVKNNPVKSGLVKSWKDWKGTFVDSRFLDSLE